jgi:hypothetical protein
MNEPPLTLATINTEARISSQIIAERLGIQHENAISLVRDYQQDFEALGILRFETGEIRGRGQPTKHAMLNEDQAYLLLTFSRNTERARALKVELVRAFRLARENRPVSSDPVLASLEVIGELRRRQLTLEDQVAAVQAELEMTTINTVEVSQIYTVAQAIARANGGRYRMVWSEFKKRYNLAGYRDLPRAKFRDALEWLNAWYERTRRGDFGIEA